MTLVIDASMAIAASGSDRSLDAIPDPRLVAPSLMWSEANSVLHEMRWRGELSDAEAIRCRDRVADSRVEELSPKSLREIAWEIADELGWAKTYDAEYLALARILDCRMVTVDRRLRRGADRLGCVVTPEELA